VYGPKPNSYVDESEDDGNDPFDGIQLSVAGWEPLLDGVLLQVFPFVAERLSIQALLHREDSDVIRQFHERGDEGMVEVLADLEADEVLRWRIVDLLRDLDR
jgi:hypothetical protein